MCILIFLLPCQQGCFKGCISKCVLNFPRPCGSDTCIHIQLPPGATFNDHNTWIFKDAAQVMYVLEIILSHVGKKLFTTKSQVMA